MAAILAEAAGADLDWAAPVDCAARVKETHMLGGTTPLLAGVKADSEGCVAKLLAAEHARPSRRRRADAAHRACATARCSSRPPADGRVGRRQGAKWANSTVDGEPRRPPGCVARSSKQVQRLTARRLRRLAPARPLARRRRRGVARRRRRRRRRRPAADAALPLLRNGHNAAPPRAAKPSLRAPPPASPPPTAAAPSRARPRRPRQRPPAGTRRRRRRAASDSDHDGHRELRKFAGGGEKSGRAAPSQEDGSSQSPVTQRWQSLNS